MFYILTITHKHEGLQVSMDQRFSVIHNILNIFLIMIMFFAFFPPRIQQFLQQVMIWEQLYHIFNWKKWVINKKGHFHHLS